MVVRARLLGGLRRLDDAEAVLRGALTEHVGDQELSRTLAEVLLAHGRAADAADVLDPLARREDADLATLAALGEALAPLPDGGAASGRVAELRARLAARKDGAVDLLRLDARLAFAAGDAKKAAPLLDRYLARRPADARAWCEAAGVRAKCGDADAAVVAVRRALEIAPGMTEARTALARLLFVDAGRRLGAGDRPGARTALEESVELAPDWTPARTALAVTLFDQRLPDLSDAQCRKILERTPDDVVARLVLAWTKDGRGDAVGALADLDALVAAHPDQAAVKLQRGLMRLRQSRPTQAADDLRAAAAGGCKGADLEYALAGCAVFAKRTDEALVHARRAVELAPNWSFSHRALGEALASNGETDAAVTEWNVAFDLEPRDAAPIVAAAGVLVEAGRWPEALAETDRLARPVGRALALRAEAAYRVGRVGEARAWFEQAAPDFPDAWLRAGALADELGDRPAAARAGEGAVAAGPTDRAVRLHLAALLLDLGRAGEALPLLEAVLVETPDDVGALNNLTLALVADVGEPVARLDAAELAARKTRLARPLALVARIRALAPTIADVADTAGWVRWLAGDAVGAREMYADAIGRGDCADARFHLALADFRDGQDAAARTGLERALASSPKAPWAARAKRLLARR
ncbi:MAG: tetratricopeptide repeat protein [Planctomycetes bacterium]|nr:tetratricopeptide repeat protein [Planctomycetota bacterium]